MQNKSKSCFDTFTAAFYSLVIMLLCTAVIIYAPQVREAVIAAVMRCLNVIIPSLFAFMALSQIAVKSGLHEYISKPFYPISKYILKMPPQLFFVLLMGSISGYPMGIKLLSDMRENGEISEKTAEVMSVFCYCGGPAFYVGTVGLAVFASKQVGLLIFLSVLSANTLTACVMCRIFKTDCDKRKSQAALNPQIFTDSVLSAGKSLFTICTMIIFCSAGIAVLDSVHFFDVIASAANASQNTQTLVKACFEITFLTQLEGVPYRLLPYIAAICSFGGICVVLQAAALNKAGIKLRMFLLMRPICAALSAIFCRLYKPLIVPEAVQTMASGKILVNFNNFIPSICLILMIFLLGLKKSLVISEEI